MSDEFEMLGSQPPQIVAEKLREIGDDEAAQEYEELAQKTERGERGFEFFSPRNWLNTQHQIGFIPRFEPGSQRYQKIVSASNLEPNMNLQNQRINVRLDRLRVFDYPRPLINFGANVHTILFTFEARNQISSGSEPVVFNQTYRARTGQDVADIGNPIFIGLNVGSNGVGFTCETINVGNSNDEKLVGAITSQATTTGLNLLETAQPALVPFVSLAKELGMALASRSQNIPVQKIRLGLDFDRGAPGIRLAIGSYIVSQVPTPDEITWNDWSYDTENGTIVKTNPPISGQAKPEILPYNTIVFRVSNWQPS